MMINADGCVYTRCCLQINNHLGSFINPRHVLRIISVESHPVRVFLALKLFCARGHFVVFVGF